MAQDPSKSELDRLVIPDDYKKRILDFLDFNLSLPSTGINDEPTRCYRANIEWAKIIEGFLDWLTEIAAWREAENENYLGIQSVLEFLEGVDCETMPIDCEEVEACLETSETIIDIQTEIAYLEAQLMTMSEDVCAGVICALEEMAQRMLLAANKENVLSDIAIGKDNGDIVIVNPPGVEPEPIEATSLEYANGLTYAVGKGFKEFIQVIRDNDTALSPVIAKKLTSIYEMTVDYTDAGLQAAVDAFVTADAAVVPEEAISASKISELVWLYGASKSSLYRYSFFLADDVTQNFGDAVEGLIDFIDNSQVAKWYQSGQNQPRNDYTTYPDFRNAPSTVFVVTPALLFTGAATKAFTAIWSDAIPKAQGNRYMIKATGFITNTVLGRTIDAVYEQTASDYQYNALTGLVSIGGDIAIESQPPRRSDHAYSCYYTNNYGGSTNMNGMRYFNNLPLWSAGDCIGQINYQLFDLGKV